MTRALGVFGGAFDPIHYGHVRTVAEVRAALDLACVHFIPTARPPHRAPPVASAEHRLEMVRLALAELTGVVADPREFMRPGPSFTVDTLTSLRAEFPAQPLILIIGADALAGFETWHRAEEILQLASIVAMTRPGARPGVVADLPAWAQPRRAPTAAALAEAPGRVWLQSVTPQPISSSAVRAAIARRDTPTEWLSPSVWQYILSNELYRA